MRSSALIKGGVVACVTVLCLALFQVQSAGAERYVNKASTYLGIDEVKLKKGYRLRIDRYTHAKPYTLSVTVTNKKLGFTSTYQVPFKKLKAKQAKGSLGKFGSINLRFKATGKPKKLERSKECKGKPGTETPGFMVGTLHFKGDQAIKGVKKTKLKATFSQYPRSVCNYPKSPDPKRKPVKMYSLSLEAPKGGTLYVSKNDREKVATYSYTESEKVGKVEVTRSINLGAGKSTFTNVGTTSATVKPPKPFSGSATFAKVTETKTEWVEWLEDYDTYETTTTQITGNLTLNLPTGKKIVFAGTGANGYLSEGTFS